MQGCSCCFGLTEHSRVCDLVAHVTAREPHDSHGPGWFLESVSPLQTHTYTHALAHAHDVEQDGLTGATRLAGHGCVQKASHRTIPRTTDTPLSSPSHTAIGAPLVYADQAWSIGKRRNSEGFSKDVCAVLLIANIARCFWWFHERFEFGECSCGGPSHTSWLLNSTPRVITQHYSCSPSS